MHKLETLWGRSVRVGDMPLVRINYKDKEKLFCNSQSVNEAYSRAITFEKRKYILNAI